MTTKKTSSKPVSEFSLGHQHLDVTVIVKAMHQESRERVDHLMDKVRLAIEAIPHNEWGVSPKERAK